MSARPGGSERTGIGPASARLSAPHRALRHGEAESSPLAAASVMFAYGVGIPVWKLVRRMDHGIVRVEVGRPTAPQ